ncbi:MAG: hypothetical protein QG588_15, partial [Candidatus Poribacteria bacterium]|nr:hypothetical protein [Candidatus Poribacteria bacterium]
ITIKGNKIEGNKEGMIKNEAINAKVELSN